MRLLVWKKMEKRYNRRINGFLILILIILAPALLNIKQTHRESRYPEYAFYPIERGESFPGVYNSLQKEDAEKINSFHKITLGIPISINEESEEGLTAIPGIGPKLACAIIKEREKRGGFKHLYEIASINGIGSSLYRRIIKYIEL